MGWCGGRKGEGEMLQLKYNLKTKQQPKPCWAWQASHTCIPATEEAETRDHLSPRVQDQPGQASPATHSDQQRSFTVPTHN